MRVLIACEFSGIVRDAFTKRGHDATSCDILDTEKPGKHYKGDIMDILNDKWDLMIAHPPCTHLSVAGAPSFAAKIADGRQQAALEFVKKLMDAPIPRICIENPISIISTKIRKPDQIVRPYYFGDKSPKKICLWLKGLPQLTYFTEETLFGTRTKVEPEYVLYKSKKTKSGYSKYPIEWKLYGKGHGKERSAFFPAVAAAMAEQWG